MATIRPRSGSDEDTLAAAIDCLSAWRRGGDPRDVRSSLAAIRPRLSDMDLPDGLLASVDGVLGQDLEDQWAAPAVEPRRG